MSGRIRWLVAGIGDITTRRVIPAIEAEPRSELHGFVSKHPAKAERYRRPVWESLAQALEDPAIDAVYIGTPVFLHHPQTIEALRAGKHVLCEKPVALDFEQAREMAETARECGRSLGIAYYRRHYPKVLRARELLQAGAIGRPVIAEINCRHWFNAEDGRRTWLLEKEKAGGGPLYDIASHRIDVLNFLFGAPEKAVGYLSNAVHQNSVEDSATMLIEYASGVRGVVDVRWHCRRPADDCRITGTEGELEMSPLNGPLLRYPGGEEELPVHENVHLPLIGNFVDHLVDGSPLLSSGETAMWTDWVTSRVLATP